MLIEVSDFLMFAREDLHGFYIAKALLGMLHNLGIFVQLLLGNPTHITAIEYGNAGQGGHHQRTDQCQFG